jgi:hypothetical protein
MAPKVNRRPTTDFDLTRCAVEGCPTPATAVVATRVVMPDSIQLGVVATCPAHLEIAVPVGQRALRKDIVEALEKGWTPAHVLAAVLAAWPKPAAVSATLSGPEAS